MERDEILEQMRTEVQDLMRRAKPLPEAVEALVTAIGTFRRSKLSADGLPGFAPAGYNEDTFRNAEVLADLLQRELDEWQEDQEDDANALDA